MALSTHPSVGCCVEQEAARKTHRESSRKFLKAARRKQSLIKARTPVIDPSTSSCCSATGVYPGTSDKQMIVIHFESKSLYRERDISEHHIDMFGVSMIFTYLFSIPSLSTVGFPQHFSCWFCFFFFPTSLHPAG